MEKLTDIEILILKLALNTYEIYEKDHAATKLDYLASIKEKLNKAYLDIKNEGISKQV